MWPRFFTRAPPIFRPARNPLARNVHGRTQTTTEAPRQTTRVADAPASNPTSSLAQQTQPSAPQKLKAAEGDEFLLYEKPRAKTHRAFIYGLAGTQLLFWFSLGELALRNFEEVLERDAETGAVVRAEKAPFVTRALASGVCAAVGLAIAAGAHVYAKRIVSRIVLCRDGRSVQVDSLNLVGRAQRVYPANQLITLDRAFTGHGPFGTDLPARVAKDVATAGKTRFIGVKSLADGQTFFVERQGRFPDPSVWDFMFYRSSNAASGHRVQV